MRIPLDYYRILGLPLAASEEQLRQAYSDRVVQLPRREYSQAAIASRKQLIEEAYVVLSDPKERRAYDQLYLAHAYGADGDRHAVVALEEPAEDRDTEYQQKNLSIEINDDELVGALLILQELGEYELVLNLGRPCIVDKNGTNVVSGNTITSGGHLSEASVERPDVVLTVALACLELGREEWQQGHYENAAISLETGEELLTKEGLFTTVRAEIQADLYRLRPYRILELLALPLEQIQKRQQGLQILQNILDERGGIDGNGNDQSGLSIDDFLRFIQQLRHHLTVTEQHNIFEKESVRPSAVASYLAVYALIARGFTQRQAALIRQAKQMLVHLGKRQDVHLEQSLCALLLGQTEAATRCLEMSQEYEALVFIREHSQDSPDLLPGLCLYVEKWLQEEVFPHFRDLVNQTAALKDYFADEEVQAYLETVSMETREIRQEWQDNRPSSSSQKVRPLHNTSPNPTSSPRSNSQTSENWKVSSLPPEVNSARGGSETVQKTVASSREAIADNRQSSQSRQSRQSRAIATPPPERQRTPSSPRVVVRKRRSSINPEAKVQLLWKIIASVGGIVVFWLLISQIYGWVLNIVSPIPNLQGEPLTVKINDSPVKIPDSNSQPQFPEGELTENTAEEVIQTWLSTKAAALGNNHEIASLEQILTGSALKQWQQIAEQEKTANRYRQYEHNLKIESVKKKDGDQDHAFVEASVSEVTQFFENEQMQKTNNDKIRVRYDLIRVDGVWRIRDMAVISNS